jgi:serine O-acetyltransferase
MKILIFGKIPPSIGSVATAGSKNLGSPRIGNNAVIGANSVVMHDVPLGCIVVGTPAKIIKREIKMEDYV